MESLYSHYQLLQIDKISKFYETYLKRSLVIEKTVKENLPDNFQTSEYLKSHGMIDIVIPRNEQKDKISNILKILTNNIV